MKDRMDGKATGTGGGVNHGFVNVRVEHLDAHIDNMARSEILPLRTLANLHSEVFKGFVDDLKVRVEEFNIFEERHAGDEVVGLQFDVLVGKKYTGPLALGSVKQAVNAFLEFTGRGAVDAEFEVFPFLAGREAFHSS